MISLSSRWNIGWLYLSLFLEPRHSLDNIYHLSLAESLSSLRVIRRLKNTNRIQSIIVTEVTVRSPFITYSSQNPWNFLDMEVIMIKEDNAC